MSRKAKEEKLQNSGISSGNKLKNYLQMIQFFDISTENYIYLCDIKNDRVYFTDKIRERFPIPETEGEGNSIEEWMSVVYSKDRAIVLENCRLVKNGEQKTYNNEYRLVDRDGIPCWVSSRGTTIDDENGQPSMMLGRVSELVVGHKVDGLTGLRSRDKFIEDMEQCLKENDGFLMILDVDDFKTVNIRNGRNFGNQLLKKITNALEQNSDYSLKLYRLDGDCFAVNFVRHTEEDVLRYYNAVKENLDGFCTVSAGVVPYKAAEQTECETVYQYAESALDRAKKDGKNMLSFFSPDKYQKALEKIEILDEIEAAVQDGCPGFSLYYQPQINTQDYSIYGAEVLLRYTSPSKGAISPVEFIPMLEQNGLICPVGEWVLKNALEQCKEWRKVIPNFHISVNMSYVQLKQGEIESTVLNLLKEAELPGEVLTLELTESMQLQDYRYFNKIFYEWKAHGIKISIDDFGTGYSSLSYLKSIEIDEIKIDRCFVNRVQYNAYNYRLLSNMIELAHSAKIKICCEGVETTEELAVLQDLSADILQGYLFAQPYTVEAFEQAYICKDAKAYRDRILKESNFRRMEATETNELLEELRNDEIGNIVEGMEETVYVSDVDTHELYYLNAAGRRMTGVYDYRGRKCYEVLQGKNAPCEFCTNHLLNQDEFYVWESKNAYLNRHNILKDKLIPWQGRIARLEMAIDITEKEIVSQSIQKKLRFEQAIVEASQILASETDSVKANYDVLKMVGEFCQGDRAYILRRKESQSSWELLCEWCMEGIARTTERDWMELDDVTEQIDAQRIAVPIIRNGILLAFVCVDHPRYIEEGSELVKTMVCFLGYRIIGEETREKLNKLLEFSYEDIRNHAGLGLWLIRIKPETDEHELYPDPVLCKLMEMDDNLSPREKYSSWYDNVKKEYIGYVNDHMREMIQSGKITSLEYPWVAPSGKTVTVHCVGIRREDSNGMICLDGYHWVVRK